MASSLDPFIPRPHVLERDRVAVVADVATSWAAVRALEGRNSRFVRALFGLRHLADYVSGRVSEAMDDDTEPQSFDDLALPGGDLQVLSEVPGQSLVVGSIARLGDTTRGAHPVAPHDFSRFDLPGFGKLAWGLSVEKRQSGGSWITFELRVCVTDEADLPAFGSAWKLISPFTQAIRTVVLGLLEKKLEPIDTEHTALPGDLLMRARFTRTLGVVIEAKPAEVWPWLLQLGGERAGWYSVESAPNFERVNPEWPALQLGSLVDARPGGSSKLEVLLLEHARALVLGSPSVRPGGRLLAPPGLEHDFRLTWAFVLEPIGDDACWLGARVRADSAYGLELALRCGWEVLGQKVLQRTQLQNIKARVERTAVELPVPSSTEPRLVRTPSAPRLRTVGRRRSATRRGAG
jgi:hypothetical protein